MQADVVVLGGGAAGFFAAIAAARSAPEARVLLLERTHKLLGKVRISGGGRCNVTHDCHDLDALITHYPRGGRWLKKALGRWPVAKTIGWFAAEGVQLKKEADGRMFPTSDDSATIVAALTEAAKKAGVRVLLGQDASALQPNRKGWHVVLSNGSTIEAANVVVATGGSPKAAGLQWLADLGHEIVPPVPSLFSFNIAHAPLLALQGLAVQDVRIGLVGHKLKQQGAVLVTHWGLSGPAVLRLSAWGARALAQMNYQATLHINWLPAYNAETMQETLYAWRAQHPTRQLSGRNTAGLPERLWQYLVARGGADASLTWASSTKAELRSLAAVLTQDTYKTQGKTTYKEEFVTAGGVALGGVDAASMCSKLHSGLYFCGEVLDIDGVTGGFNFQAAWATGHLAGTQAGMQTHTE